MKFLFSMCHGNLWRNFGIGPFLGGSAADCLDGVRNALKAAGLDAKATAFVRVFGTTNTHLRRFSRRLPPFGSESAGRFVNVLAAVADAGL